MAERYNDWTNYETWNVKLWMDNEEGSYRYWQDVAQECYDDAEGDEESAVSMLRERLKDEHEEGMSNLLDGAKASASVWADLLGAALGEVNWHEIAASLIEDVDKVDKENEPNEDAAD